MNHNIFEKEISTSPDVAIAILFGYNEQDIVVSTILNALKQGLHVYYVDDFSTDATRSLVEKYFCSNERVGYCIMDNDYRANDVSEKSWSLKKQLMFKSKLARTKFLQYQWILHMDCDEVYECPWAPTIVEGLLTLPPTVGKINCQVWDYFPTNLDAQTWKFDPIKNEPMLDITSVLTVYRQRNDSNTYYRFLRNSASLDFDFGHCAKTEPDTLHSQNMIMHHFPYRSKELAENKVSQDRLPRISTNDANAGIGWHYKLAQTLQLPIDMKTANQNVVIVDGRYTTYYLCRK